MRAACLILLMAAALVGPAATCPFFGGSRRGLATRLPPGHPPLVSDATTMAALRAIATRGQQGVNATGDSAYDDFALVREEIRYILEHPEPWNYDDGSWGPIALRLAWHSAATWDPTPPDGEPRGGAQGGASMRFEPEASYEENTGLELPRAFLEPIRALNPMLSYADIWILAGYEAVECLGGPHIPFRAGRVDVREGGPANSPPEERLPAAMDPTESIRAKFSRMGLDARQQVALMGAHTLGRPHAPWPYRSWDNSPVVFDSMYFDFVLVRLPSAMRYHDDSNNAFPAHQQTRWRRRSVQSKAHALSFAALRRASPTRTSLGSSWRGREAPAGSTGGSGGAG